MHTIRLPLYVHFINCENKLPVVVARSEVVRWINFTRKQWR